MDSNDGLTQTNTAHFYTGGTREFDYDAKGRRIQTAYPNNILTQYTYDAADRVLSISTGDIVAPARIDSAGVIKH